METIFTFFLNYEQYIVLFTISYGSMSLNNNNPVNNEGRGSSNGSGNRAEDKGKDKGFGFLGASHEHSDQIKDRKGDR